MDSTPGRSEYPLSRGSPGHGHSKPGSPLASTYTERFESRVSTSGTAAEGLTMMSTLREDQEEKQKLEKENFDLKMKVYYMEENMRKMQEGEQMHDLHEEQKKGEINKLHLQNEELRVDLEQRNLLLIKSKGAIEALKAEIERLRGEIDHQHEIEDRVRRLQKLNSDIEADYKVQIAQLEAQLDGTRQMLSNKDAEKTSTEEKAVSNL